MRPRTKKQKLDTATTDCLKILPLEVWQEILNYVTATDLENLSLVCRSFYQIIGSLTEVMDRLMLKIENRDVFDCPTILKSSRKYTNVYIGEENEKSACAKILKKIGSDVRSLTIQCDILSKKEFMKICELTHQNLKTLKIKYTKVRKGKATAAARKSFKLNNLKDLEIRNSDVLNLLADLLPDNNLSSFSFVCCYVDMDITDFPEILQRQKNLKHLKLKLYAYGSGRLNLIYNSKIQFKLNSLDIDIWNGLVLHAKFREFLQTQSEHLEILTVNELPFAGFKGVFKNIPKVKKLSIFGRDDEIFGSANEYVYSPSLETLRINYVPHFVANENFRIFQKFSSIPEIIIKVPINQYIMNSVSACPGLKKLTINRFYDEFFKVSLQDLTELTFEDASDTRTDIEMDDVFVSAKNLEVLKMGRGCYISTKSLFWLLRHFKKLKHLEIQNGSGIKSTFLCTEMHLFQNLEFLRISSMSALTEEFKMHLNQFPKLKYYLKKN